MRINGTGCIFVVKEILKRTLLLAVAAALIQSVHGGVKVEGNLYSDEPGGKRTFPWKLVINDDGSYNLKTIMTNGNGTVVWLETGSDGLDAYHLKRPTTLEDRQGTNEFGFVTKGPFPASHYGTGQAIWLALSSGQFINSNGIAKLPSLTGFKMNQDLYPEIKASGETFSAPPKLPKHVIFKAPPYILDRQKEKVRRGTRDYVAGEFKSMSTTNLSGYVIPLTFEFVRYLPPGTSVAKSPKTKGSTTNQADRVSVRHYGVINKIEIIPNHDSASMLPPITCRDVSVLDYRFTEEKGGEVRGYRIDDGRWLNRSDAKRRN